VLLLSIKIRSKCQSLVAQDKWNSKNRNVPQMQDSTNGKYVNNKESMLKQ